MSVLIKGKTVDANRVLLTLGGESVIEHQNFKAGVCLWSFKIIQALAPSNTTSSLVFKSIPRPVTTRSNWVDFNETTSGTNITATVRTIDAANAKTDNTSSNFSVTANNTVVNLWMKYDGYSNQLKFYANGSQLGTTITPPGTGVGFDSDWAEVDFQLASRMLDGLDYEFIQYATWLMPTSETTNANIDNYLPTDAEILAHTGENDVSALTSVAPRILIKPTGTNGAQFITAANTGSLGGNLTQTQGATSAPDWPTYVTVVPTYPQVVVLKGDTTLANRAILRLSGHTVMPSLPKAMAFYLEFKLRGLQSGLTLDDSIFSTSATVQSQGGVVYFYASNSLAQLSINFRSQNDAGSISGLLTKSDDYQVQIGDRDKTFRVFGRVNYINATIDYFREIGGVMTQWGTQKTISGANPRLLGGAIVPSFMARQMGDIEIIKSAVWHASSTETDVNVPAIPSIAQILASVGGDLALMPTPQFLIENITGKTNQSQATGITNTGSAGGTVGQLSSGGGQTSGALMPFFWPKDPLVAVNVNAITKTAANIRYDNLAPTGTLYLMTGIATKNPVYPTSDQVKAGLNQDGSAGTLNTITLSAAGSNIDSALSGLTHGSGYHTYGVIEYGTARSDVIKWQFSTLDILSRTSLKLIGQTSGRASLELQGHSAIAQGVKGISCLIRGRVKGALSGFTENYAVFETGASGEGVFLQMTSDGSSTKMRMNMRALNSGGNIAATTTQSDEITVPEVDFDYIFWGAIDCLSAQPTIKYFVKITSGANAGLMTQLGATINLSGTGVLPQGGPFVPKFSARQLEGADIEFSECRMWFIPAAETNAANINTHIPTDGFIAQYWAEKSVSSMPLPYVVMRPSGLTYDNNTLAANISNLGTAGGNFIQITGPTSSPNWPHFVGYDELTYNSITPKAFSALIDFISQASGRLWMIICDPALNTTDPSRDQIKLKQNYDGTAVLTGIDVQHYEKKSLQNELFGVLTPGQTYRFYGFIQKGYGDTNIIKVDFTAKIPGLTFTNGTDNLKVPGGANYANQTGVTVKYNGRTVTSSATTNAQGVLSTINLAPLNAPFLEIGDTKDFEIRKGNYTAVISKTIVDVTGL